MENQTVTSPKYQLNYKDVLRGLLMAIGTPVVYELQQVLDSGSLHVNWKHLGMIAFGAGLVYITKNFLTGPSKKTEITNEEAKASEEPKAAK